MGLGDRSFVDCKANSRICTVWVPLALIALACLPSALSGPPDAAKAPAHWPSFRGPSGSGVADQQNLPDQWSVEAATNIRWKTPIPGLAHSSPIVWENRVFVTSAVRSGGEASIRHGLYGDGDTAEDRKDIHAWKLFCLDKATGKLLWERTAHEGIPRSGRHIKATYANNSPATNGERVLAFFGSEGLYAFDMDGNLQWQKDLGVLDLGAYNAPNYEWGSASSPIIYENLVFVQCDTQKEDFIIALDLKTGATVWRTERDELPSWGTPGVFQGKGRTELITNASNFIRAYDPKTGKELWRLGGSSQITAPTPIFTEDLIVVASGRRPEKPIFVIRPGGAGDITLKEGETSNDFVVWSEQSKGSYMPTPIIYGDLLYVLKNDGVLDCFELKTGKEVYRQRLPHAGGGFSASPVAADGKIYCSGEDGDIFVIKAGREYEVLASNPMGELILATPALSEGSLIVRGIANLISVGR